MRLRHRSLKGDLSGGGAGVLVLALMLSTTVIANGQDGAEDAQPPQTVPVASSVQGTSTLVGQVQTGSVTIEGGVVRTRDNVLLTIEDATDPRARGRARISVNIDAYQNAGDGPLGLQVRFGTMRLVNDGGAWEGRFTGRLNANGFAQTYWLEGEGAYAGLTYVVTAFGSGPVWTSSGLIYPGEPPDGIPPGLLQQDLPELRPLARR